MKSKDIPPTYYFTGWSQCNDLPSCPAYVQRFKEGIQVFRLDLFPPPVEILRAFVRHVFA